MDIEPPSKKLGVPNPRRRKLLKQFSALFTGVLLTKSVPSFPDTTPTTTILSPDALSIPIETPTPISGTQEKPIDLNEYFQVENNDPKVKQQFMDLVGRVFSRDKKEAKPLLDHFSQYISSVKITDKDDWNMEYEEKDGKKVLLLVLHSINFHILHAVPYRNFCLAKRLLNQYILLCTFKTFIVHLPAKISGTGY